MHDPRSGNNGSSTGSDFWRRLSAEFDRWAATGRPATFWWRDDDAGDTSWPLDRLLGIAIAHDVPLALAVIPARLTGRLVHRVAETPRLYVMQHGWSHDNRAREPERMTELSDDWDRGDADHWLLEGRRRLAEGFGPRFLPAMVPPWNRMGDGMAAHLSTLGFQAVSGLGIRSGSEPGPTRLNIHVDIMNWETRRFAGDHPALDTTIRHLEARRTGAADPDEVTGIMSHHQFHDEDCWQFLDRLAAVVAGHPGAVWCDPANLMAGLNGSRSHEPAQLSASGPDRRLCPGRLRPRADRAAAGVAAHALGAGKPVRRCGAALRPVPGDDGSEAPDCGRSR
jgi:hypothetical protein